MDRNSKYQLPENLRELEQKLKALDAMMLNNVIEKGSVPHLPLPDINELTDRLNTTNYLRSQFN